jgi:hypothetical protein
MTENVEFIDQKKERRENKSNSLREFLTGNLLASKKVVEQLPYIIFVSLLIFLYIANRYHAEKIARETMLLKEEVKELRAEATSSYTRLMRMSRQSQVEKLVENQGIGLRQITKPPQKIVIPEKE